MTATAVGLRWLQVCRVEELQKERGSCVLVEGRQIAVIRTWNDEIYALDNRDPFTGAQVLSRGLVGTVGNRAVLASPMLKHRFDLVTGVSLDDADIRVATVPVRRHGEFVEVGLP